MRPRPWRWGAPALVAMLLLFGCATAERRPSPPSQMTNATPSPAVAPTRADEFQAALDRLGLPLELPDEGKAIVVNIPAFELVAFEDGEPVFESRVIVGTPRNPTPVLATTTETVRFRPTWRPTPDMIASGEYEDRVWPPGENNPLGLAAVRFANGILVYLHDTNRPGLFAEEERALSHGCIRVERWRDLVAWLLDMPLAEVDRLARGGRTVDVPTPPVPVYLTHLTAFPDRDGTIARYDDLYGVGDRVPAGDTAPPAEACTGDAFTTLMDSGGG